MPKSQELKQLLEELGIETEEDSLVIQRDISASGKMFAVSTDELSTLLI